MKRNILVGLAGIAALAAAVAVGTAGREAAVASLVPADARLVRVARTMPPPDPGPKPGPKPKPKRDDAAWPLEVAGR